MLPIENGSAESSSKKDAKYLENGTKQSDQLNDPRGASPVEPLAREKVVQCELEARSQPLSEVDSCRKPADVCDGAMTVQDSSLSENVSSPEHCSAARQFLLFLLFRLAV